jgi:hypothetical protein
MKKSRTNLTQQILTWLTYLKPLIELAVMLIKYALGS